MQNNSLHRKMGRLHASLSSSTKARSFHAFQISKLQCNRRSLCEMGQFSIYYTMTKSVIVSFACDSSRRME